jgi:hypothetical protein
MLENGGDEDWSLLDVRWDELELRPRGLVLPPEPR